MPNITRPTKSTSDYVSNKAIWSVLLPLKSLTLAVGSFGEGGTVSGVDVALLNQSDGYCYKYTGPDSFPILVTAGSSPDSSWTMVT